MSQHADNETIIDYTQAESPRRLLRITLGFIITWLAIAGIIYQNLSQTSQSAGKNDDIKSMRNEIGNVNASLANAAKKIALNSDAIGSFSDSLVAVDKLQKAVFDLPNQIKVPEDKNKADKKDIFVISEQITNINNRIDNLQKEQKNKEIFNSTAYTIIKLRERINLSQGYTIELDLIKRLTASDLTMQNFLNELDKILQNGTPALAYLREDFAALIDDILAANKTENQDSEKDKSFWGNVSDSLSDQIKIRKIDVKQGDNSTEATIAKIEKALRNGDLNAAIKRSGELNGKAADIVSNWRNQLKNLHKSEVLFQQIYEQSKIEKTEDNIPTELENSITNALDQKLENTPVSAN